MADDTGSRRSASAISGTPSVQSMPCWLNTRTRSPSRRQMNREAIVLDFIGPRRITRWEHEHILEVVQRRLDEHPEKMRQRRETVEHPFGTIKAPMGATHFLMKTLPRVATEMALHVLAYNLTRVMNIMGIQPLMAAMRA